ncbi:patatin-like phospholipase family protein [Fulvivirga maritima]|uniref:patatin-like phospholipase family protein n=1 Tax=Fulvivirga maritima TaxID=2904247 RepID=UPI00272DCFD0|nr:patatin-like phospholipase family protein [Fulvivirga maritima]
MSKSVALVLSSGGARGVAHIGVIEALLEAGYEITSISGSSMGAVVGAVYAAGKLNEYKDWVCNFDKIDVFKLIDFTLSTQGFVRGDRVFNEMKKFIPDCNIEDLSIPFAAVATDIVNRREVVFTSGSVFGALRASAAIPSVMKPAVINDIELVDGGVLNPIPIDCVQRSNDDILVVSDVNAAIPAPVKNKQLDHKGRFSPLVEKWNSFFPKVTHKQRRLSYFDLIAKSGDLMQDRISEYILAQTKPEILVRISRETCGTFEFYRSNELIDCGKEEFLKSLEHALQGVESDAG